MNPVESFLSTVIALPGVTGHESEVASYIAEAFAPLCDEVSIDCMQNVIAHKRGTGPKVMLSAHLDEIGMVVTQIEQDGCLRLGNAGGVDPRVLPGMRVTVHGKEKLLGVIGAKAPHLLSPADMDKNYTRDDLHVDLGLPYAKVTELVNIGDCITFEARFIKLLNGRIATKTVDDRGCVAIMLRAAQMLKGREHQADLYFVSTCQEEVGCYGALTAGHTVAPDIGIALDVCHAATPGAPIHRVHPIDKVVTTTGPYINPFLFNKLKEVAKEQNIPLDIGVAARSTGTDTDNLGIVAGGVPMLLMELPLKYMHTNVETFDMHILEEAARLLCNYLCAIDETWGERLWT